MRVLKSGRWLGFFFAASVAGSGLAAPAAFQKLEIENPQFTHQEVGIFELELEKAANFLAIYVYKNFAQPIKAGDNTRRLQARRYLSLALHMDPQNVTARRINEMLAEGNTEDLETPLPQKPKDFVEFLGRLIEQLKTRPEAPAKKLAGYLSLVAADLDPANEDAVYAAELFLQKSGDQASIWKELVVGKAPIP